MRRLVTLVVAGLLVTSAYAPLEAQSTGTITGQVTDQSTGRPLGSVQVFVAGTNRNTLSNAEGRYVLTGVPAGEIGRASCRERVWDLVGAVCDESKEGRRGKFAKAG